MYYRGATETLSHVDRSYLHMMLYLEMFQLLHVSININYIGIDVILIIHF